MGEFCHKLTPRSKKGMLPHRWVRDLCSLWFNLGEASRVPTRNGAKDVEVVDPLPVACSAKEAGKLYDIKMEFYWNGGGAEAKLTWSSTRQTKQIVP